MLIALLAPEVLLFFAISERVHAGILLKKALKCHPHLAKPGIVTRIYTYIRGLATPRTVSTRHRSDTLPITNWIEQSRYNTTPQRYFTLGHAFYAMMGGFAFYTNDDDATLTVEESLFELSNNPNYIIRIPTFKACIYIVEHFPNVFTDIPEESIFERAKSSSLSKAVLIVQVGWFCTNCASRLFQRLPLSLLEVTTAAHAFCTLLTYFVWWSKPLNVMAPTIIKGKEARGVYALLNCSSVEYSEALEMAKRMAARDSSIKTEGNEKEKIVLAANVLQHRLTATVPPAMAYRNQDTLMAGSSVDHWEMDWIVIPISPILYGLIHCLAWNDNFPTPLERLFWRASSVVVTCSGLTVTFGLNIGDSRFVWRYTGLIRSIIDGVIVILLALCIFVIPTAHMLASLFLIGESFRQLFFLDPAAYQLPSWSNYWPHLS